MACEKGEKPKLIEVPLTQNNHHPAPILILHVVCCFQSNWSILYVAMLVKNSLKYVLPKLITQTV
jgi:hypothetical protein